MSQADTPSDDESSAFEAIPDEFKERDQWLLWDSSNDTPRQPHWKGDFGISWSDPDDWHSFEEAVAAAESRESWGIGYVMAADNDAYTPGVYGCIDIDRGIDENGELKDWVPDLSPFTDALTYIEYSPSGNGLHIPIVGSDEPDWWSDSQIDEHEGVDVLTNKFCTFTADMHPNSGSSVAGVDPTSWLFEAYQNVRGESPRLSDPAGATSSYDGDEYLEHSDVKDALDNIDPDLEHTEWVKIGYAVHDFDDGSRGKSLFESWSKQGTKWDENAQRTIDTIWSKADSGNGVTLGTLIHHAKKGGWSPPNPKGSTSETTTIDTNDNELPVPSLFDVRNGGYAKFHPPRDDDSDGYYERITNFQVETLSRLTHDDGTREFHLRIHPADGENYDVTCEPVVFNDLRKFRREVLDGWTTTFDGSQDDLNRLKEFVGNQEAKHRTGTKLIGLHSDEFVTPDGALTGDGWADDPNTVFTDVETPLSTAFNLKPSEGADYDRESVREILRLLPQTRTVERFLPVIGWFYAAPFRPHIQQWEGEFNILNILGDTGSGKTTTLETLWQAFGVNEELPEAKATPFSIMRMIASSNAVPVLLDEYKPSEIRDYKLNELHSNLRASTRGAVETKGRPDMGVDRFHLKAPICISGEQPIQGPAEERRTILTVFKRDVTVGETPEQESFARLVGGEANGEWYDGHDLTHHALAYYQWVLQQDPDELHELWKNSRRLVMDLLEGSEYTGLDDMVIQGFQTIKFGCTLYRAFANEIGLDPDGTPVTPDAIEQAIHYVADGGTGAEHTSHLDRLLGIMSRAASAGYLERGKHYDVVHEGEPNAELGVHMKTAFDKVRKYARDHDVRGDDLLSSAGDYKARIKDAADDPESYVVTHSQRTMGVRCSRFHIADTAELVDGFEPEAFGITTERDETHSDRFNPVSIHDVADDPTGYPTVKGEIKAVDYPEGDDSPALKATLVDGKAAIDVISWDDSSCLEHGEQVIIENADTSEFNGTTQLVIKDGVTVIHEAPDDEQRQIDDPEI